LLKKIILGSLRQMTVGHTTQGFWRHPDAQGDRYNTLEYWIEYAKTLERGGFDFLFFADVVGALDVFQGSPDPSLRGGVELPMADPMLVISALASHTTRLGFAVTGSTTYEKPYLLARTYSTLDHLTRGRIGFNVVTSALESAAVNLGYDRQIPHDERYEIAEEFLEVVYKLWEGSWEDDAVVRDRANNVYTNPAKVHPIEHRGPRFSVPGIALTEPSPQRTPVIFQAGISDRGRRFAADHAEAVFLVNDRADASARQVAHIRRLADEAGRVGAHIKVLSMATIVVAETDDAARAKEADYRQYFDIESQLAQLSALFGIDLSAAGLDDTLEHVETDSIRGMLEIYTKLDPTRRWTIREVAEANSLGGAGVLFVGSPTTIADAMEAWLADTGADGFNVADPVPPLLTRDVVDLLIPELRRRGLVDAADAEPSTLRERLLGPGHTRTVAGEHPSAAYRRVAAK
jgi:FMN-dependent oxidoreductase (nitrilotriacetate monooxygenase family)